MTRLWLWFIGSDILALAVLMQEHPEQWKGGDRDHLRHGSGIDLWAINLMMFDDVRLPGGTVRHMNLVERVYLWRRVKRLKRLLVLSAIRKHEARA